MGSVCVCFIADLRMTDDRDYDSWGERVLDNDSLSVSSLPHHIVVSTGFHERLRSYEKLGGG